MGVQGRHGERQEKVLSLGGDDNCVWARWLIFQLGDLLHCADLAVFFHSQHAIGQRRLRNVKLSGDHGLVFAIVETTASAKVAPKKCSFGHVSNKELWSCMVCLPRKTRASFTIPRGV